MESVKIGLNEMLNGAAQLPTSELEKLMNEIGNLLLIRRKKVLPKRETELLLAINQAFPDELKSRFYELSEKLETQKLTIEENQEFENLVDAMELHDASRLENLIELARLRGVKLEVLMSQLELKKPNYA